MYVIQYTYYVNILKASFFISKGSKQILPPPPTSSIKLFKSVCLSCLIS